MSESTPSAAPIEPPRRPGEILSLTALRGILALWVLLYHFWSDVLCLFPRANVLSPFVWVGHLAVPAFFLLSGFVLAYNYGYCFQQPRRHEVGRFLFLRFARIYPVHFVTLLIVLAMVVASQRFDYRLTDSRYTTRDFVLNLFLVHTWVPLFSLNWNHPAWSISSEWFAYLLFPMAVGVGLRHLTTSLRAVVACGALLAGAIALMEWCPKWPFYQLVLVVPTFFAGATAFWVLGARIGTGRSPVWWWLPEALVLIAAASTFAPAYGVKLAVILTCSLTAIMALAWLGNGCSRLWTAWPAVFLGEVSYSLYMTHTLAQKAVSRLLPSERFESDGTFAKAGVLLAYCILIAVACLGMYWLVERPCRAACKNLISKPAA